MSQENVDFKLTSDLFLSRRSQEDVRNARIYGLRRVSANRLCMVSVESSSCQQHRLRPIIKGKTELGGEPP